MKLKVDKEMKISFEAFYKEWLLKNNILFGENNDSFLLCTPMGELIETVNIIYDSPEEKEEFIKYVESKGYECHK